MAHNLLDECLLSLSTLEWRQLEQWLQSPLHHAHQPSLGLFQHLYNHYRKTGELPNKDSYCANESAPVLSPLQLRKYRSLLLDSVEQFLSWLHWTNRTADHSNALLAAYRQRGLLQNLRKRVKRIRQQRADQPLWSADQLAADFRREEFALIVDTLDDRRLVTPFVDAEKNLLRWQTAERLRKAVGTLARAQTSGSPIPAPLLEDYLQLVESDDDLLKQPAIVLYYHICRLYQREDQTPIDHFEALTRLLPLWIDGFPPDEQSDLLKLTINQAIRHINEDPKPETLRTALDLYQLGLQRQLLFEGGYLSKFTCNNLLSIAFRLQEIDLARYFLGTYANKFPPTDQEEVLALNTARLCYVEKNYEGALLCLQNIDYQDPFDLLNARTLQIKIYYETEEYQALSDLIRATRAILRRRKLGYHQHNFRNNLRLTQRLLQLNWSDTKAIERIKEQIQSTSPLSEREWLLKQLI